LRDSAGSPDTVLEVDAENPAIRLQRKMPDVGFYINIRHERTWSAFRALFLLFYGESGTAKYAVNTPVSVLALPVISPLLLMSLAFVSFKGKLPLRSFRSVGVLP
jgi:hypothetical protein